MKKTFKKIEANAKFMGVFPFEFKEAASGVSIPDSIHIIPVGSWDHDLYGPILINASDIREFAQNFNMKIRKGVFITAGHEGFMELPANGWITEVEAKDDGLWGKVEWNDLGRATLSDKQYKYFSPEFYRDYEDPQTHQIYRNVLTGGALTKSPYFKELEAIVFSEPKLKKQFSQTNMKTLAELLAMDIAALSDEEKAFIKEHESELTEEQKASHTSIIDVGETPEEKEAREQKEAGEKAEKEKGDANEAAGLNRDGSAKSTDTQTHSEKKMITMSEAEATLLREQANQGAQAFKELEAAKLETAVGVLVFSQTNKDGKFLPKTKDKVKSFMAKLDAAQRLEFSAILKELPETQVFAEKGSEGATDGTATAELNAKVDAKMKADDKLKYADALKQVLSENSGLEERYDSERTSGKKAQKV